jgi:archaellum component FlaC
MKEPKSETKGEGERVLARRKGSIPAHSPLTRPIAAKISALEKELKDKESSRNNWQSKCGELEASVKHLAEIANDKYPQEQRLLKEIENLRLQVAELKAEQKEWKEAFAKNSREAARDLQEHIVLGHIQDAYRLVAVMEKEARSLGFEEGKKWTLDEIEKRVYAIHNELGSINHENTKKLLEIIAQLRQQKEGNG